MNTTEEHNQKEIEKKYVVMSFKSIGINTYNVMVLDLENEKLKYWHESVSSEAALEGGSSEDKDKSDGEKGPENSIL